MSTDLKDFIQKKFNKAKKEAQKQLDNNLVDKTELINSIRVIRKNLAKKNKNYIYRDEVTEHEMLVHLANRINANN